MIEFQQPSRGLAPTGIGPNGLSRNGQLGKCPSARGAAQPGRPQIGWTASNGVIARAGWDGSPLDSEPLGQHELRFAVEYPLRLSRNRRRAFGWS
jgi:hypothetical protein